MALRHVQAAHASCDDMTFNVGHKKEQTEPKRARGDVIRLILLVVILCVLSYVFRPQPQREVPNNNAPEAEQPPPSQEAVRNTNSNVNSKPSRRKKRTKRSLGPEGALQASGYPRAGE